MQVEKMDVVVVKTFHSKELALFAKNFVRILCFVYFFTKLCVIFVFIAIYIYATLVCRIIHRLIMVLN